MFVKNYTREVGLSLFGGGGDDENTAIRHVKLSKLFATQDAISFETELYDWA